MNHVSVHQAGTKLSINLQSQNTEEPTPFGFRVQEARFWRDFENSGVTEIVNSQSQENSTFSPGLPILRSNEGNRPSVGRRMLAHEDRMFNG